MQYGKLINGEPELLKMPIRTEEEHIFTNDDELIRAEGYKAVIYTEPEIREGFFVSGFVWTETDPQIVREWEYTEAGSNEYHDQ